jgi:hypothetical protein
MPRISFLLWCAIVKSHSIWSSPRALGWIGESGWGSHLSMILLILQKIWKISSRCHVSRSPRALNPNPTKFGDKDLTVVVCRQKMTSYEITKMMVQMMGIRLWIWKTPFFRLINPEKMINRIFKPNNPPNDPSDSEYPRTWLLNFGTVTFPHPAGYLTPR